MTAYNLVEVLKSTGMTNAFSGSADFSGISGSSGLYIAVVLHRAYVFVHEKGTEAAAATAGGFGGGMYSDDAQVLRFNADHPFMFLIRDNKSGSILFMGRVMDPRR